MGEVGDQHMEPLSDADWSGESFTDEGDPAAPCDTDVGGITMRYGNFSHHDFTFKLHRQILPNDTEHREEFDIPSIFRLGDPNVHFHAAAAKTYETSGEIGKPEWDTLFGYILAKMSCLRFMSTAYVLVDDRDLTNLDNRHASLQHWPAVAAWWSSRVRMIGPAQERCDVVYVPISHGSGLHKVHPTWAGTFVLAALSLVFPRLRIVLLDSDCVPVTLFEVGDLWKEVQVVRPHGLPCEAATSSCAGEVNLDPQVQASGPLPPVGQGVLLVTEHNAEVNAGFVVLFGSNHDSPLSEDEWQNIPLAPCDKQEQAIAKYQQVLVCAYWQLVSQMTSHGRDDRDMTPEECRAWIQTGLALTPFCGCIMNTSLEWTVAWSLVGEWTTGTLFLPPQGPWPRQGHPKALVSPYDQRSVPMLT